MIRLLAAVILLTGPYMAFAIYFLGQYPSDNEPEWLTTTLAVWFTANFLILVWILRRRAREPTASQNTPVSPAATATLNSGLIIWMGWLLVVWSVFLIYGFVETVTGQIPLRRALVAGTFLLLFIGLFGKGLYGELRKKRRCR